MKRRWKKFLAGVLSAALALNLAAPLALAGNSTIGAACSVTSVFLYPEYVGRVDGENVSCIQGEVSYDHGLLTFHGDVTLTTVGVADLGTVPLVKALSEKNLRLVANGKVTGRTKGNGIEEAKEIAGGEYNLTYADLGAYLDTKPNGILGGDTGTTITAGTEITLKDFHTGIGGGDVRIDGTVNITGAMFEGATYGIANFTTMNPGSELEIHADRYIRKDCLLTYNGGHLLMIVAENGDGNNIVQGRLSIGNDVSRFWYRTDENGAYTEINVKENYENFTAAIGQNQDYLELTDVDPDQPESETYDLWVAGKQVTKTNQSNVLGDGTVSYDPDTHTLTLNNAHLTLGEDAEEGISSCIDSDLTDDMLTITGTATLFDADGILTDGPLTLKDATLTFTGNIDGDIGDDAIRAGRSDEDITIQNSTVTIAGTNAEGNFFQYGIRCGNLIVANSTLNVKANSSAIVADELKASGAGTVITAETDSTDEDDYALELEYLTRYDGLVLVEGEMNKSKKARIARPEQAPTYFKVYWVVHPGDEPVNGGMQIPGAIFGSEEEERLFEGWFLEDGTRLEDSPYYMGPGVDHVGNLDRDVTFYGRWCTAEQLRTLTFEGGTVAVNSGLKIGYTAEESPVKLAPGSRVTLTLDESKAADHRFVIDPIPADWTTSGRTATFTMPDADTTVTVEQRAENPANYKVYWVVHPGDTPQRGMQIPGAIVENEEEARLFEGWFLEDGTRLEDSPYYMGPGVDHVGNLDRDVTFYGHWRTAESDEGSGDGGDGFGTLLAVGAVVGVAGVVAYQVGTELILDQLLPAGVAVPHTRAELAMLLWNTAGRPAPATLPAFAEVADPELAQAAQWAIEQGYLKARADGSFKPDKGVAKWRVIRGYRAVTEP